MGLLDFEFLGVTNENLKDKNWDSVILVCENLNWDAAFNSDLAYLKPAVVDALKIDKEVASAPSTFYFKDKLINFMVFAQAGPVNLEYEDSRKFADATVAAVKRALSAGCKRPLIVCPGSFSFDSYAMVISLAALEACYVPIEIREDVPARAKKVDALGFYIGKYGESLIDKAVVSNVEALECGRIVARDIGGSDPERMAAKNVEEYVKKVFNDGSVTVEVESDIKVLEKKYPLMAAVNRAASHIPRHQGRVITLEYIPQGEIKSTFMLVGKGVTYDTGGADVKAGGVMAGMHRDKCGSAAVAGFLKTVSVLKPQGIKVVGKMSMVRNSIGADSYVADEIITSAAGVRVRVGNTDAEGRMAMADPLHHTSVQALKEVEPHLMTIATLTGHAIRAVGPAYTLVLDNGPARKKRFAQLIQENGEKLADPFEISTIRREDYKFIEGPSEYEDILQCNNLPSSGTPRGHQFPAAFLIKTSGLDKHGLGSEKPLCYSHFDIAGSSGPFPGIPTGSPIVALAKTVGLI